MTGETNGKLDLATSAMIRHLYQDELRELHRDLQDALSLIWTAYGSGELTIMARAALNARECAEAFGAAVGALCAEALDAANRAK